MGISLSVCWVTMGKLWANYGQTWANLGKFPNRDKIPGKKLDKVLDKVLILGQGVGQASELEQGLWQRQSSENSHS